MSKKVSFFIDEDVYEKFLLAMDISKESEEEAIEMCMRWYIAKTFEKASHEYKPKKVSKSAEGVNDYYGKAIGRIPIWALKPEQYNHKIIRAYFTALDIAESATISMMEQLCSEKDYPELYVPTFKNRLCFNIMLKFKGFFKGSQMTSFNPHFEEKYRCQRHLYNVYFIKFASLII